MNRENSINKKLNYGIILAVYLFGIFMGALDTGIVTPARTLIQNNFHVSEQAGIWLITIYTLAYAASIPVMGKLADKYGRKIIYLVSIVLFGAGSLLCGLSENFGSFAVLLAARSIQAVGGGGIVPVATAEFGTIFPENKRGLALGLVGGVYGIANIFGSSAGSAILDLLGKNNWQFIFYINVPISLFIIIAGLLSLPNTKMENVKKIDFVGIVLLVLMILSLIYGLRNIDFFQFGQSVQSTKVYPFLMVFAALLPFFLLAERKADDPLMNLGYFTNFKIVMILIFSIISGVILMGMIFVPQFAENELRIATGSGGYFVIILGVFAGVGSPFSGKLIDRYGAKPILGLGFLLSVVGSLFLILAAIPYPSFLTVFLSLMLVGLGVGFTIGTPLNYMMLANTDKKESNSALATLSLVRSIGTTIAPAIMVGFLAHAGSAVQSNIMDQLPKSFSIPPLPYAQDLNEKLTKYKNDPKLKDKLAGIDFPDLTAMTTINISMTDGTNNVPSALLDKLKAADVTTITETVRRFATEMYRLNTPQVTADITGGIQKGIDSLSASRADLAQQLKLLQAAASTPLGGVKENTAAVGSTQTSDTAEGGAAMNRAAAGGTVQMQAAVKGMQSAINEMDNTVKQMEALKSAIPGAFEQGLQNYLTEIENHSTKIEAVFQTTLNNGFRQIYLFILIATAGAIFCLIFYPESRKEKQI